MVVLITQFLKYKHRHPKSRCERLIVHLVVFRNVTNYCRTLLYAPINVMPAGRGGRAWGGDLIVFVVPGVGHLTDLVLPGEGIFESFFARRGDI